MLATGQIAAADVEGDPFYLGFGDPAANSGWTFTMTSQGQWTFTSKAGYAGLMATYVGVVPKFLTDTGGGDDPDLDQILVTVAPPTQATAGTRYAINIQTPEELSTPRPAGFAYSLFA